MFDILKQVRECGYLRSTVSRNSLVSNGFENPADIAFYHQSTYEIMSKRIGHYIEITHLVTPQKRHRIISHSTFRTTADLQSNIKESITNSVEQLIMK